MVMKSIVLLGLIFLQCPGLTQQPFTVELPAASFDRVDIPLRILIPYNSPQATYFELKEKNSNRIYLARSDGNHLVFIPTTTITAGTITSYTAKPIGKQPADAIRFHTSANGIAATVNNKPVFHYQSATAMPPPDSPQYYQRSGFIHPLYTPGGTVLTDDFPDGHVHQHAIFMAWSNTMFRGKKIDFWNQHLQTGTVQHVQLLEALPGAVYGKLKVKLKHVGAGFGTILEETWIITVYQLKKNFLFDLESIQKNITADTLFLLQYIYGGMAMRGSKYWNNHSPVYRGDSMQLVTSEGMNRHTANHTHARFVTMYGKIGPGSGGVTVFDHKNNFRYPQVIRVHPEMPYWVYTPVFDGKFEIAPHQIFRSKYRYFVFDEVPDAENIKSLGESWHMPEKKTGSD